MRERRGMPYFYRTSIFQNQRKRNKRVFAYRLQKFIDNTRLGIIYGDWNDYGRLLEE